MFSEPPEEEEDDNDIFPIERPGKPGVVNNWRFRNYKEDIDIPTFLDGRERVIKDFMYSSLKEFKSYKLTGCMTVIMKKGEGANYEEISVYLQTEDYPFLIQTPNNIDDFSLSFLASMFEERMENFNTNGSGWTLKNVEYLDLSFIKYERQKGGSYIPTPYLNKFALNINTGDKDDCFNLCILAHFYPIDRQDHYNRRTKYEYRYGEAYNDFGLDFSRCEQPMPIDKIRYFEDRNPILSICVYQKNRKNDSPKPLYISKFLYQRKHHVNLLLLEAKDNFGNLKSHYCLITNYNAFCNAGYTQTSEINQSNHNSYIFCPLCQSRTKSKEAFKKHIRMCLHHKPANATYPEKGKNIMEFKHIERTQKHPWVGYFDYEAFQKATKDKYTKEHIESGVGLFYGGEYKSYTAKKENRAPSRFLIDELEDKMHEAYKIRKNPIPMNELTQEQREQHSKAKNCYICEKEFKIRQKVIDWSKKGNYHGACHLECTKETSAGKRNLTEEESQDYISQTNVTSVERILN